ncbi:cytochrome P450 [Nocardia sp. NPDC059240]|uniref:cytochrome P450 n=1 Tax=Nocardia sp. NPDC059240 TaxID=3346786 RepID=UPI00369AFC66
MGNVAQDIDPTSIASTLASRPPGPSLATLGAIAARSVQRPYGLLPVIAARCGDVVDIPVPLRGWTMTLVSHPDHVDHIMTRHHQRYAKHIATQQLVLGEPPALPLLEGDEWKRTRRPLNPYFGEKALAGISPAMIAAITERVELWGLRAGQPLDLEHELGAVVMDGLMRSMFSAVLTTEELDAYVEGVGDFGRYVVARAVTYGVPGRVPRPFQTKGERAKAQLLAALDSQIARRYAEGPRTPVDIMDVLLGMEFPGTPEERYRRLRSELSGLVFAGFETTAEALAWTLALLARNPIALVRAYEEVDGLGGGSLEYGHVSRLPWLRACFDEAQRIQAAPANIRTALEDDEIGGYFIPAGSHVVISPYGLHHDPRFWTRPEIYRPERFLADDIDRNAFIPFNTGPRKCMGSRMAYLEGVITLAAILQRYTIHVRDGWQPRHRIRVSTGLAGGLPARIRHR